MTFRLVEAGLRLIVRPLGLEIVRQVDLEQQAASLKRLVRELFAALELIASLPTETIPIGSAPILARELTEASREALRRTFDDASVLPPPWSTAPRRRGP
jgi:hypothetical protein